MSGDETPAVVRRIRPDEVDVYRAFRLRALADSPDAFSDSYAAAMARPESFWHERVAQTAAGLETVLMVAADAATDTWLGMTGCYMEHPSDGEALVVSGLGVAALGRRRRRLAQRL